MDYFLETIWVHFWFKQILFRRKGLGVAYNAPVPLTGSLLKDSIYMSFNGYDPVFCPAVVPWCRMYSNLAHSLKDISDWLLRPALCKKLLSTR